MGDDPASAIYVRGKIKASREAGIASETHRLPATTTAPELAGLLERLNRDEAVDAILLQLPLPDGLDASGFLARIRPDKDVDGFSSRERGPPGGRPSRPVPVYPGGNHGDVPP